MFPRGHLAVSGDSYHNWGTRGVLLASGVEAKDAAKCTGKPSVLPNYLSLKYVIYIEYKIDH